MLYWNDKLFHKYQINIDISFITKISDNTISPIIYSKRISYFTVVEIIYTIFQVTFYYFYHKKGLITYRKNETINRNIHNFLLSLNTIHAYFSFLLICHSIND